MCDHSRLGALVVLYLVQSIMYLTKSGKPVSSLISTYVILDILGGPTSFVIKLHSPGMFIIWWSIFTS